ncbi:MAG: hypothetical protein ACLVG5_12305 [Clostridium sp.]
MVPVWEKAFTVVDEMENVWRMAGNEIFVGCNMDEKYRAYRNSTCKDNLGERRLSL